MILRDELRQIMDEQDNTANVIEGHLQSCQKCRNGHECGQMEAYRQIAADILRKLDKALETV